MKKIVKEVGLLAFLLCLAIVFGWRFSKLNLEKIKDFRIMRINENGIRLESISPQRRMINSLTIDKETQVWVPEGMGWYRSGKVKKLLSQEKKAYLAEGVAFYNFGFVPDVIFFEESLDWTADWSMLKKWGVVGYIGHQLNKSWLLVKDETISGNLADSKSIIDKIAPRDLADSDLLREDWRINIYNTGQSNGLAAFLSENLERSGFTVIGVESLADSKNEVSGNRCLINYGKKTEESRGFLVINKLFKNCQMRFSQELGEMEVELYFGDEFSQMINYSSYNNLVN